MYRKELYHLLSELRHTRIKKRDVTGCGSVLIKGVQYNAKDPSQLGKTFLRLERDFDQHVTYCQDEPKAQQIISSNAEMKNYFQEISKKLNDDKTLEDHLKLPVQRINDYQLLFKSFSLELPQELIKYSERLNEDTTDLRRALKFMQAIPQRSADIKLTNTVEGYRGNILKMGRLLLHVGRCSLRYE
ncbi:Unc-89 [Cordylochernes scorpioides]|uniref:Unc-89 n=1 Tax=Cordylochernes scorpioides TaxID=51811 RepID=A0ABY6LTW7_9ARAC|nr:Unc-89 [Cordylochernes scorpioides]